MINYIRHDEEFVTDPVEIQVVTKTAGNGTVKGIVMNKWMQFSDEDFFILNEKDIMTIGGLSDELIHMYKLFIKKASSNENIEDAIKESKVELDEEMGFVSKVDEARRKLEKIYKYL